ncbi:hypothetical protein CRU98_10695 [Arcobacter sp. CECT 8986]|uniref:hypothetical protein n=1 Tax=Arcobacter sp. CECT 8986 TaxID=2044507 RepID=UPI001009E61B|nr:hypothetical protein [Arcobacter sp. CECT 8986]RXJ98221.1 hypothetical protein CRU98_10695 [Arcobacter sp. CECT 8986]
MQYFDTYFLDANEALKEAKKNNKIIGQNPRIKFDQICYYNAQEELENAPSNCIFVPFENVYNYFVTTKNRRPTKLNYDNIEISQEERKEFTNAFTSVLTQVEQEREALTEIYKKQIQEYKPDFNDEKLRVFIPANKATTVMQHISKNIAKAFEQTGKYEVCYLIQEDDMQAMDYLIYYHKIDEFKPHITFNINHTYNSFLHKDVFNFVWFQDTMEIVTNKEPLNQRKRDYIYCLIPGIKYALEKKGAKNISLQNFCIDTSIYKKREEIKKEKKIVFIGGSYKDNLTPYLNSIGENKELISDRRREEILKDLLDIYKNRGTFYLEEIKFLAKKHKCPIAYFNNYAIPLIVRDFTLLELVKENIDYELEIYGWGWEEYEELKPYYKGVLNYGEEISKVYNSATYAIVTHPSYTIQQRTLESVASHCTPLVYDCSENYICEEESYKEELILFKNLKELFKILKEEPKVKVSEKLIEEFSYVNLVKKIEKTVLEEIHAEK